MALQSQLESSVHAERHYAVTEIAEMWNLSVDKVRELFGKSPVCSLLGNKTDVKNDGMLRCASRSPSLNAYTFDYHRNVYARI